jgi:hypothetical protein
MSDDEQTIGDASTGAEEHHVEESGEPGHDEGAEGADEDVDERSPWAE